MNEATQSLPRARKEIKLTAADEARFWAKVDKNGPTMPHMQTPCWMWTAGKFRRGYGAFRVGEVTLPASRVAWLFANKIVGGLLVCHRCDNPSCVNLEHLFLGTDADNMSDKVAKGRQPKGVCSTSKLTDAKVIAIRTIYAVGVTTLKQLAEKYGVSIQLISYIIRREKWKHVP